MLHPGCSTIMFMRSTVYKYIFFLKFVILINGSYIILLALYYRLTINIPVPSVFQHEFQNLVSNFLSWRTTVFGRHRLCLFSCWKTDGTGILIARLLIVNLYINILIYIYILSSTSLYRDSQDKACIHTPMYTYTYTPLTYPLKKRAPRPT